MSDRRTATQEVSFVERWVHSGKACYVANFVAVFTSVTVFLIIGGFEMAAVSVVCLTAISFSISDNAGRVERIRRGKEILNRYCPERKP